MNPIDINFVITELSSAFKGTLGGKWPKVKSEIQKFLIDLENKQEKLNELKRSAKISEEEFNSYFQDLVELSDGTPYLKRELEKALAQKIVLTVSKILFKIIKKFI